MTRISTDVRWVLAGTVLAAALALLGAPDAVRLLPGLAASLLLPGYAMSVALFPDRDFDTAERLALAFGLSLALIAVSSIVISWTPWGFRSTPIVVGISGTTIGLCLIAEWRRRRTSARPTGLVARRNFADARPSLASVPFPVVTLLVVFALAGSGIALAAFPRSPVTEFYAVGDGGSGEADPQRVVAGKESAFEVGIKNGEGRRTSFRVAVMLNGQRIGTVGPITLDDREEWRGHVDFAVPAPGSGQMLDVRLYKEESPEPYRSLRLWVDALPGP